MVGSGRRLPPHEDSIHEMSDITIGPSDTQKKRSGHGSDGLLPGSKKLLVDVEGVLFCR